MRSHSIRLAVAVALASLSGCSDGTTSERETDEHMPQRAVLVVLDAARPDRFSAYAYRRDTTPEIDRLAASGVRFDACYAQGVDTRSTLPALLFSRYYLPPLFPASRHVPLTSPEEMRVGLDPEAVSLPRAFAAHGFETALVSAHVWLRPDSDFAREFDTHFDLPNESSKPETTNGGGHTAYPPANRAIDRALGWLDEHADDDVFLYVHLMDTHFPHAYGPEAAAFFETTGSELPSAQRRRRLETASPVPRGPLTGADRDYVDALYDGSLRAADREVGRLLDRLASLDGGAWVAVTADHGEHLWEVAGRSTHGGAWYRPVAHIPWLLGPVGDPARRDAATPTVPPGSTVETVVEAIDVGPTLLGRFGLDLPAGKAHDGVDRLAARAESTTPEPPHAFATGGQAAFSAARDARWVAHFGVPDAVLFAEPPATIAEIPGRLFDLESDPWEQTDLWHTRPDEARRLLAAYRDELRRPYRRHLQTRGPLVARGPFAFQATRGAPDLRQIGRTAAATLTRVDGWTGLRFGGRSWLFVAAEHRPEDRAVRAPGAPSLAVDLPMPDGAFAMSARIRGRCRFVVDAGAAPIDLRLRARPLPLDAAGRLDDRHAGDRQVGRVRVEGGNLSLRIEPWGDKSCAVATFGFEPLDPTAESAADGASSAIDPANDDERTRQLRALGYL